MGHLPRRFLQRLQDTLGHIARACAEGNLPEGIELYPCPGHTWSHCGLRVETRWGTLVVAGDSVMTPEHFQAEEGHSNAVDFALSTRTIQAIKADAELVIPGHANLILNLGGA